jgi:hypothetical protein
MKKKKVKIELLSMTAYAKRREVSYEIIRRYCKDKPTKITLVDGKIDPVAADKELAANLKINGNAKLGAKGTKVTGENHTVEFNKAKARREKSKADLAELEYAEKAGKVHSNESCAREAESLYRAYRDQMLNVTIRATKKLLGVTDEFKFRRILKAEIENAIKQVK